jgi:hypothetical protein
MVFDPVWPSITCRDLTWEFNQLVVAALRQDVHVV